MTLLPNPSAPLAADEAARAFDLLFDADLSDEAIAGFLVTMGTLGDRIGRRKVLLIGAFFFGAAFLAAAFFFGAAFLAATETELVFIMILFWLNKLVNALILYFKIFGYVFSLLLV